MKHTGTKTATYSTIKPVQAEVTLTYRNGQFAAKPDPVKVRKGDTLTFKYDTDLKDPQMVIALDPNFFSPEIFEYGDQPVQAIRTGYSEYSCRMKGTFDGKYKSYDSTNGGYGGSCDPRDP